MTRTSPSPQTPPAPIDLTLVAQRILKLAELSMLEHLDSLDRSQAVGLSQTLRPHATQNRPNHRPR